MPYLSKWMTNSMKYSRFPNKNLWWISKFKHIFVPSLSLCYSATNTNNLFTNIHCRFFLLLWGEPYFKKKTIPHIPFYIHLTYPLCCLRHSLSTYCSHSYLILLLDVIHTFLPYLYINEYQGLRYIIDNFHELRLQLLWISENIGQVR